MIFLAFIVAFKTFSLDMTISAYIAESQIFFKPFIMTWVAVITMILVLIIRKIVANQTDIICHNTLAIRAFYTRTLNSVALSAFDFFHIFLNQLMDFFLSKLLLYLLFMALFTRVYLETDIANNITISSHIVPANFVYINF